MAMIHIEHGDAMPPVCARCGAPAEVHVAREFQLKEGGHSFIIPFLLPGIIGWVSIRTAGRERVQTVNVPFCRAHQHHWRWRKILGWSSAAVLVAISILAVAVGSQLGYRLLNLVPLAALLVGLCIDSILHWTSIRSTFVDTNNVVLVGVCTEFEEQFSELHKQRTAGSSTPAAIIGSYSFPESSAAEREEKDNPFADLGS